MGSEDLHHKRKAKDTKSLQRRKSRRASYDKILIVCEGQKTEPQYLYELIRDYKLNTANIEIDGTCGSTPKSVLERAEILEKAEIKKCDPYDRIYCVFDKDTHETYEETKRKIETKNGFYATVSVPCFEYWLLLHFKRTTKPYHAKGGSSIANEVLKPTFRTNKNNIVFLHKFIFMSN